MCNAAEDVVALEQGYVAVKNRDTMADDHMKILEVGDGQDQTDRSIDQALFY
jgi:hypothetical protein